MEGSKKREGDTDAKSKKRLWLFGSIIFALLAELGSVVVVWLVGSCILSSNMNLGSCSLPLKEIILGEVAYFSDEDDLSKIEPQSIPYVSCSTNHPVVKTCVDGWRQPVLLCTDTGASQTCLVKSIFAKFPIAGSGSSSFGLTGKNIETEMVCLPALRLGKIIFHRVLVSQIPSQNLFQAAGYDGVIGMNLMRHMTVTFDHQKHEIVMTPPKKYLAPKGSIVLDLTTVGKSNSEEAYPIYGDVPVINCKLDGIEQRFILDTGSPFCILPESQIKKFKAAEKNFSSELKFKEYGAWGDGRKVLRAMCSFAKIQSGELQVPDPVFFVEREAGKPVEGSLGLLGNDFLQGFKRVTFDMTNRRVVFELYENGFRQSGYLSTRGESLMFEKRYAEALTLFNRALAIGEPDARDYCNRGVAYNWLNRHQEAISDCEKSIRKSESSRAYLFLGCSQMALGMNSEAVKAFTKALELNPLSAEAYYQRAFAEDHLQAGNAMLKDLNEAVRLDPQISARFKIQLKSSGPPGITILSPVAQDAKH